MLPTMFDLIQPASRILVALPARMRRLRLAASLLALMPCAAESATAIQTPAVLPEGQGFAPVWHGPHTAQLDPALARLDRALARRAAADGLTRSKNPTPIDVTEDRALDDGVGEGLADDAPPGTVPERYSISVTAAGLALHATGPLGTLHAMSTLALTARSGGWAFGTQSACPKVRWRALRVDVTQRFLSLTDVEHRIDAAALLGLNILHLTVARGDVFRVESRRYPKLGSGGTIYTQAQIHALIDYAAARGLHVVPEIDLSGRSPALLSAYPDLGQDTIDLARPETIQFLLVLYGEIGRLFGSHALDPGMTLGSAPEPARTALRERLATRLKRDGGTMIVTDAPRTPSHAAITSGTDGLVSPGDVRAADAMWSGGAASDASRRATIINTILKPGPLE
jgi:hypothetical protein